MQLEQALQQRGRAEDFFLITQNVDGLHRRAGQSSQRCAEVHGNLEMLRCDSHASSELWMHQAGVPTDLSAAALKGEDRGLRCSQCGQLGRPHVLWFDECYDEALYRSESALREVQQCDLLVVVGTSGNTSLPLHAGMIARENGAAIVDINLEENPFSQLARDADCGGAVVGSAAEQLPALVDALLA